MAANTFQNAEASRIDEVLAEHLPGRGAPQRPQGAELRQAVLVALGRRVMSPPESNVLLKDAAELVAEALGTRFFGYACVHRDSPRAILHLGDRLQSGDAMDEQQQRADDPKRAIGWCLTKAKTLVVDDLNIDAPIQDSTLLDCGIRSVLMCPLMHVDRAFGTLGVFDPEPRAFDRQERMFVESVAHLMTTTLARNDAEEALARHASFSQMVLQTLEAPVITLSSDARVLDLNRAAEELTGFSRKSIRDRHFLSAFLIPEEVALVEEAFEQLRRGNSPARFDSFLLTREGERRRVSWSFSTFNEEPSSGNGGSDAADGGGLKLIGTGIDITKQCEALERLEQVERESRETKDSLDQIKRGIESSGFVFDVETGTLTTLGTDEVQDRRNRTRREYPYVQFVGSIRDGKLPPRKLFRQVRCRDISPRGFAFYSPESPTETQLVIAFGQQPDIIYLVAEVVHVTPVEQNGKPMYVVGCQYVGRAEY